MSKIGTLFLILGLVSGCATKQEFVNPIFNSVLEPYNIRGQRQQIFPDHIQGLDDFYESIPNTCSLIENTQTSITLKCFNRLTLADGSKNNFWIFERYYYFGHFDNNFKCDIFSETAFSIEELYTDSSHSGYYIKSCLDKKKSQEKKACEKKCLEKKRGISQ